jgi:hypothetical protein
VVTDAVLTVLLSCVDALVTLLPNVSVPDPGATAVSDGTLTQIALSVNAVVPLGAVCAGLLACVACELALLAFEALLWVYHQIWGAA